MATPRSSIVAPRAIHPMALPPTLSPDSIDCITQMVDELVKLHTLATSDISAASGTNTPAGANVNNSTGRASPKSMNAQLKELVHIADGLKHNVQRARTQIRQLPDMGRTIGEQEEEIEDLLRKIERQKEVLRQLKEAGVRFAVDGQQIQA